MRGDTALTAAAAPTTTPAFEDESVRCFLGNALDVLSALPDASIDCVVTSPPYFGLRAYGTSSVVWGGDKDCAHEWGATERGKRTDLVPVEGGSASRTGTDRRFTGVGTDGDRFCRRCGGWRGELGAEPTPALYVDHLVAIFQEVRRVLRPHGTAWLVIGDCYQGGARGRTAKPRTGVRSVQGRASDVPVAPHRLPLPQLKPKDLIGIPWRLALALQMPVLRCARCGFADHAVRWGRGPDARWICPRCLEWDTAVTEAEGWWLRQDNIWAKPNPMPESVRDRTTRAHEYVFMLTRSERYYYDAAAIKEELVSSSRALTRAAESVHAKHTLRHIAGTPIGQASFSGWLTARNRRSVWEIATQPYGGAHFAAFPERLAELCILAGTSERGHCGVCGAAWTRRIERQRCVDGAPRDDLGAWGGTDSPRRYPSGPGGHSRYMTVRRERGWEPSCAHPAAPVVRPVVLDPFAGSGTVLAVAKRLDRMAIGIELQPDYVPLVAGRCRRASAQPSLVSAFVTGHDGSGAGAAD